MFYEYALQASTGLLFAGLCSAVFWPGHRVHGIVVATIAFFSTALFAGLTGRMDDPAPVSGTEQHPDAMSEPEPASAPPPPAEPAQPMAGTTLTDDQIAGFHCLSNWNGAHRDINAAVVATLRDPDSFQHIETRVTPMNPDGTHLLFMDYRARNSFGGMNIGHVAAVVQNSDCSFTVTVQTEE